MIRATKEMGRMHAVNKSLATGRLGKHLSAPAWAILYHACAWSTWDRCEYRSGIRSIATALDLDTRQVKRGMSELVALGIFTPQERSPTASKREATVYIVRVPRRFDDGRLQLITGEVAPAKHAGRTARNTKNPNGATLKKVKNKTKSVAVLVAERDAYDNEREEQIQRELREEENQKRLDEEKKELEIQRVMKEKSDAALRMIQEQREREIAKFRELQYGYGETQEWVDEQLKDPMTARNFQKKIDAYTKAMLNLEETQEWIDQQLTDPITLPDFDLELESDRIYLAKQQEVEIKRLNLTPEQVDAKYGKINVINLGDLV